MPVITALDSPKLSVAVLLKQPQLISRALTSLIYSRLIADKVLAPGTPDQVAGGSARYQKSESIFPNQSVIEMGARSEFPRAGWDETVFTEIVRQFGLAVPINNLMIRRNQMDMVRRGIIKLANQITLLIDGRAISRIISEATTIANTVTAAAAWTASADAYADIVDAKAKIENWNEGYYVDTMIVGNTLRDKLLKNKAIRDMMPRERLDNPYSTGMLPRLLGIENVYSTSSASIAADQCILMCSGVTGTIADEAPDPMEGFSSYAPGEPFKPVWVKIDKDNEDQVIKAARWPAIWIAEPKSCALISSA